MASYIWNFFRPPPPVVERTVLSLVKEIFSKPHVQAGGVWAGGISVLSQLPRIAEIFGGIREVEEVGLATVAAEGPVSCVHVVDVSRGLLESMKPYQLGGKIAAGCAAVVLVGCVGRAIKFRLKKTKPEIVVKAYTFESAVDGSEEVNMDMAPSQVQIAVGVDKRLEIVGSGVRVDVGGKCFMLTAGHNFSRSAEAVYMVKGGDFYRFPKSAIENKIDLAADAVAVEVPSSIFSSLNVAKARLAFQPNEAYVTITGLVGKGTSGRLRLIHDQLGRLQYTGTTRGGYSGAPYWTGKSVYGLHTNGGVANEGFSLAFLYQVLKLELGVFDESYTFSWYKRFMKKKGPKNIREVGDFVIMQNDDGYVYTLTRKQHAEYQNALARELGEDEYGDEDDLDSVDSYSYVPESKNFKRPGNTRVGKRSRSVPPLDGAALRPVQILELHRLWQKRWEQLPENSRSEARSDMGLSPRRPQVKRSS